MSSCQSSTCVYFLGSIDRYHDARMSHETSYQYRDEPVERAKFISPSEGDLWHDTIRQLVDIHDNFQHYLETGRDPVTLSLEVLEVLEYFDEEWGKALMPVVIRRIAHELRTQFNLPGWLWPPIVLVVWDDFGVPCPRVPTSVDNFGREVRE